LCEQVAPKIIANAQGDSPLAENLRRLAQQIAERRATAQPDSVSWGLAAFRSGGVDVRTEKDAVPSTGQVQEIVVAEIRGRERPDEWVLLGAHLDAQDPDAVGTACNAALVVEAARDIQLTGVRPRRSIRFVLFAGAIKDGFGSWAYVHAHREELDRARAAIIFSGCAGRMTGYMLNGRHDIESGVREAMKPIESLGAGRHAFGATLGAENFDFVVEGIPTLISNREEATSLPDSHVAPVALDKIDIADLKRNTAVVAVTAFGIAERAAPIGPRQSRAEIESSLKAAGLEPQMKTAGLWPLWESGERGRLP
jgi:Zn-dependent M28 family amino/carboxypeptidase